MSLALKHSTSRLSLPSASRSAFINVFDNVLKRLEILRCTEVRTRATSYGIIFTGFYHDVGFEFNVYVNAQGRLNHKTRQNPVWHKPVTPPDRLKEAIDEVIRWVKSVDGLGCNDDTR